MKWRFSKEKGGREKKKLKRFAEVVQSNHVSIKLPIEAAKQEEEAEEEHWNFSFFFSSSSSKLLSS